MRYVYADILFLVNFCFDFSLLYLAGRLSRSPLAGRRLVLAAAVGSGYAVAAVIPSLAFVASLPAKLLFSALMVALAYPSTTRRLTGFALVLGLYYLANFAVGGTVIAWGYLTGQALTWGTGLGSPGPSLGVLVPAALFGGVLLHWAVSAGREEAKLDVRCVPCLVLVDQRRAEFRALVDTGNRLRDPLSDAPVVIVELPALSDVLPPGLEQAWGSDAEEPDLGKVTALLAGSPWCSRLRLVPFSSLGRASGLLLGFRPDAVVVRTKGSAVRRTDVVVCVSPRPLSSEGLYRGLLPPEVLTEVA